MRACATNIIACLGEEKIDILVRSLGVQTDARLCARTVHGQGRWF